MIPNSETPSVRIALSDGRVFDYPDATFDTVGRQIVVTRRGRTVDAFDIDGLRYAERSDKVEQLWPPEREPGLVR